MASSHSNELDIHQQFEFFMQRSLRGIMGSMKQDGLSMPQIYTLMYLYHEGEVRISDIGVLMDVGKAAASQLVERLAQQDLVERVEDPAAAEKPGNDRKGSEGAAESNGGVDGGALRRKNDGRSRCFWVPDRGDE